MEESTSSMYDCAKAELVRLSAKAAQLMESNSNVELFKQVVYEIKQVFSDAKKEILALEKSSSDVETTSMLQNIHERKAEFDVKATV